MYGTVFAKDTNITDVEPYIPVRNIKNIYFDNVFIKNHSVFYCEGCSGDVGNKYILVKNANINIVGNESGTIWVYNSSIKITGNIYPVLLQDGGTLNMIGGGLSFGSEIVDVIGKLVNVTYFDCIVRDESDIEIYGTTEFFSYITMINSNPETTTKVTAIGKLNYLKVGGLGLFNLTYNGNITFGYFSNADFIHNIFGISIRTKGDVFTNFERYIYSATRERINIVDNFYETQGKQLTYTIYKLHPNSKYKVYLNGTLTYTFTTSPNGVLGPFNVTFHSPVNITVEYTPTPPPKPTSFMKSLLGIGILTSFLFFILSLISSPEISVEGLLKIIGVITAILILILTYGIL